MLIKRLSLERGHSNHGWLDSYFSFSFGEYYDPKHLRFSALRVINEDRIQGAMGFDTHEHKDMEIITFVLEGAIEHKDTLEHSTIIRPGEVQRMSAGSGIAHSEFNHFKHRVSHLLQIWIFPRVKGLKPSYEQKSFQDQFASNDLTLIVSESGREGAITIHQDAEIYAGHLGKTKDLNFSCKPDRNYWIQVYQGLVSVNGESLKEGDGLGVFNEAALKFQTQNGVKFLLFDLPQEPE
jgi:redox-sensitive bicupin YhaK (pirin superfamily)